MKRPPVYYLLLLALAIPTFAHRGEYSLRAPSQRDEPALEEITSVLNKEFGAHVKLAGPVESSVVRGDFNGDGKQDLALAVNIEEAKGELTESSVKLIDTDPYSRANGSEINPASLQLHNCSGLAIVHGSSDGWKRPQTKYLSYNCFSSLKAFPKGRRIRRSSASKRPVPAPAGDSILLDLESGASALVYWTGTTYRGFGMRAGD